MFASLFGKSKSHDSSMDKLFANAADGPVTREQITIKPRTIIEIPSERSSRKRAAEDLDINENERLSDDNVAQNDENENENENENKDSKMTKQILQGDVTLKSKKSRKNKDENEDLEAQYFQAILKEDKDDNTSAKTVDEVESDQLDSKSKSLDGQNVSTAAKKSKEDDGRNDRTVFVGNVPNQVITSKSVAKSFKRLFKEHGKIDSIRFRSIAFSDQLPKKVSYVKKNLHESRDSVNAYVVFVEPKDSLKAAKALNATVFEDHHLRVDHVGEPAPKDNKRTIFVGNLDFEEKEENLWKFFNEKLDGDVESVRIVRDSVTNMGKGFALVQFKDSLSVNKALLLNDKPMNTTSGDKKARKLRISRAKYERKPVSFAGGKNGSSNISKKGGALQKKQQRASMRRAPTDMPLEGERSKKGQKVKNGKVKKPRIRERSTKFKNERNSMTKERTKPSK
ncbi:Nucleolar protein 12 [Lodderomyces elongisporus]|uniref:Nucleolar protein 12 n=1 Tax=Lodderomyces elongisporus TaxID=36914 RepID=UPI00291E2022|nr:Nucleolar protein 12 [Lodderomyces elongisporus]WLF77275.1 Nucleolar protein 12 [Lodderomyces elongisporus]